MRTIILGWGLFLLLLPATAATAQSNASLTGAWQNTSDPGETIAMMDGYFVYAKFDVGAKTFGQTWGGPFLLAGNTLTITVEFDAKDPAAAGRKKVLTVKQNSLLEIEGMGATLILKQVDNGVGPLAGNWRITSRKQGETMGDIPLRPRRTLKLLTGERFQWMAINTETGEFFGTGGGRYAFSNGKYTEHIEFFSRDGNRVGASLRFDGKVEQGQWHHSGLSSKGEPIYEIWSRMK